jgi:hypothetical protein
MALFSRKAPKSMLPPDTDLDELLKGYEDAIAALVEAVLAGGTDIDLLLAELVEGAQSQQRIAIVEKLRAMVRERSEEKAKALDAVLEQQKMLEHHRRQQVMETWLAYFMSQETLRKIRESLMVNPSMKKEVEQVGQELAKKGVLQQLEASSRGDLGGLSQQVGQGKKPDQGRGV